MKTSKRTNQTYHARRRARERFGIVLNADDIRQIVLAIQDGRADFVERQSVRVTVWRVTVGTQPAFAVYDRKRKTVVTLLTEAMWHERHNLANSLA